MAVLVKSYLIGALLSFAVRRGALLWQRHQIVTGGVVELPLYTWARLRRSSCALAVLLLAGWWLWLRVLPLVAIRVVGGVAALTLCGGLGGVWYGLCHWLWLRTSRVGTLCREGSDVFVVGEGPRTKLMPGRAAIARERDALWRGWSIWLVRGAGEGNRFVDVAVAMPGPASASPRVDLSDVPLVLYNGPHLIRVLGIASVGSE